MKSAVSALTFHLFRRQCKTDGVFFSSDDNTETVGGETQKDDPQEVTGADAEGGKQAAEVEDEWELLYSDEEMEDPKNWMPPPSEIKRLYEILAKGEMLELNFVPLPRRPPTPERTPSPERDDEEEAAKERERLEKERKSVDLLCCTSSLLNSFDSFEILVLFSRPPSPTEFDFSEEQTQTTSKNTFINRRRTPGRSADTAKIQHERRELNDFAEIS